MFDYVYVDHRFHLEEDLADPIHRHRDGGDCCDDGAAAAGGELILLLLILTSGGGEYSASRAMPCRRVRAD